MEEDLAGKLQKTETTLPSEIANEGPEHSKGAIQGIGRPSVSLTKNDIQILPPVLPNTVKQGLDKLKVSLSYSF